MLHVKSCIVKLNCESVFRYFASVANRQTDSLYLKGHSQLWGRAHLDTTFVSLKSVYLNPKSEMYTSNTSRNPFQSCLVFHSILDRLQKTSFWANVNLSYDIILSYLVKNNIQRNMNRIGEKCVGAGREKWPSLTKIAKEMNQYHRRPNNRYIYFESRWKRQGHPTGNFEKKT